jgi:hypothetical protein
LLPLESNRVHDLALAFVEIDAVSDAVDFVVEETLLLCFESRDLERPVMESIFERIDLEGLVVFVIDLNLKIWQQ